MPDVNSLLRYLIGAVIMIGIVGGGMFAVPQSTSSDVAFVQQQEASGIPDAAGGTAVSNLQVQAGLNDKVSFSGAPDSEVSTNDSVNVDSTFAVCTIASADASVVTNNEQRAVAGAGGASLYYDGTSDEWAVWWYNESSRSAFEARIAAPSPTGETLICGQHDGQQLVMTRNTTVGTSVNTAGTGGAAAPPSANWDGTLEETRVFDSPLNASQRQDLSTEPALAVTGQPPAARLSYDVRERPSTGLLGGGRYNDSVKVYFSPASASATNITYVDGVQAPSVAAGTDYELVGLYNESIRVLDGGQLERGDILYLSWTVQNTLARTLINVGLGLGLLALVAVPLLRRV